MYKKYWFYLIRLKKIFIWWPILLGPEVRGSESARWGEAGGGEQGNREHRPLTGTVPSRHSQGFGYGYVLIWLSWFRIQEDKITHKNRKKWRNFKFRTRSAGWSPLRTESFSCSLDFLYGDLWISKKNAIFWSKNIILFFRQNIFSFWSSKPWFQKYRRSGSAIRKNAGSALNQCGSEAVIRTGGESRLSRSVMLNWRNRKFLF